jgi:hypothetical protein
VHNHSADRRLAALAARQQGVVSVAQLHELGLTKHAIRARAAAGHLHRLYRGVYAVGHRAITDAGREWGALLACRGGAILSHRSAARRWGLLRYAPAIEVTCSRSRSPADGIIVHRSPLDGIDVAVVDGTPMTSAARTIVDLADVLPERTMAAVVNEAEILRLFDLRHVDEVMARLPGRCGRSRLTHVLAAWRPQPFLRSEAERLFLELCDRNGLPRPLVNASAAGYEVDSSGRRRASSLRSTAPRPT